VGSSKIGTPATFANDSSLMDEVIGGLAGNNSSPRPTPATKTLERRG